MERPYRTSSVPEKDDFYRSLVERCASAIVGSVGEKNLEAILLGGAPARGEATVIDGTEGLYSLSDIDLGLEFRTGPRRRALRLRRRLCPGPLGHRAKTPHRRHQVTIRLRCGDRPDS